MSDPSSPRPTAGPTSGPSRRLLTILFTVPVLMFGFGFAMVPLYDVFCEVTGLNGKTGRVSTADYDASKAAIVDTSRLVKVQFITHVNGGLPWEFEPEVHQMMVHPGQLTEANFIVRNDGTANVIGQAVPSVTPAQASLYFNKTECFCFTQQSVPAGATRDMPLRFVVDPNLPDDIVELTLAYTFFESKAVAANTGGDGDRG